MSDSLWTPVPSLHLAPLPGTRPGCPIGPKPRPAHLGALTQLSGPAQPHWVLEVFPTQPPGCRHGIPSARSEGSKGRVWGHAGAGGAMCAGMEMCMSRHARTPGVDMQWGTHSPHL